MKRKLLVLSIIPFLLSACDLSSLLNAPENTNKNDDAEITDKDNIVQNDIKLELVEENGRYFTFKYKIDPFDYKGHVCKILLINGKTEVFEALSGGRFKVMVADENLEEYVFSFLTLSGKKYLEYTFFYGHPEKDIVKEYDVEKEEDTGNGDDNNKDDDNKDDDDNKPIEGITYPEGYTKLDWSDEFDGNSLDMNKWIYNIGNGSSYPAGFGWGNGESQSYTNRNHSVKDGYLTITAKKESDDGQDYTSTRITTKGKYATTYGYIEARIALPLGQGFWPAFWMLPETDTYGGWPHSGEIDIMEAKGRFANRSSSAIHYSTLSWGHKYNSNEKNLPSGTIDQFHKYAVKWEENRISFYVDDVLNFYSTYDDWTTGAAPENIRAPFDKDFHIIFNLAVGGHFDGYLLPSDSSLPAQMVIDYVRVFKK